MSIHITDNIEEDVKQTIAEVTGCNVEELNLDTHFWNDLQIDSIKAIEITVAIERRYKIRVRDEQIPEIVNVRQAVDIVRQGLEKKQNG